MILCGIWAAHVDLLVLIPIAPILGGPFVLLFGVVRDANRFPGHDQTPLQLVERYDRALVDGLQECFVVDRLHEKESAHTHFDTPIFPNVLVRGSSGRIQARSLRCSGCRIQSSQKLKKESVVTNGFLLLSSRRILRHNYGELVSTRPIAYQIVQTLVDRDAIAREHHHRNDREGRIIIQVALLKLAQNPFHLRPAIFRFWDRCQWDRCTDHFIGCVLFHF
uniref:Uncharacterized protein n=1 Tax=Anopheles farauti TaxID=69004 RepID=A0A182QYV8_9DIPT